MTTIERMEKQIREAEAKMSVDDKYFWDLYHEVCSELQKIRESVNRLQDFMIDVVKMRNVEKNRKRGVWHETRRN